ncbi:putative holin-like toxin [Periweissella fabalis]
MVEKEELSLSVYEALTLMLAFGSFIIAFAGFIVGIIIALTKK